MYRNVTTISSAFRVSGVVTAEGREAPRPALGYDPAARSSTLFVNTALIHYRPSAAIELAFGREQLPTGVNVPDLAAYTKSRNRLGYYDAPTQLKLFWSAKRYHITPFVYAPGGNEPTGEHESGGGSLAEVDLIGNQRLIGGMTILRGTAANGDRRTVGAYARLGFGQWGHPRRARRHRSDENSADCRRLPADGELCAAVLGDPRMARGIGHRRAAARRRAVFRAARRGPGGNRRAAVAQGDARGRDARRTQRAHGPRDAIDHRAGRVQDRAVTAPFSGSDMGP